jgi:uncharacterized protein YecE (DUF72 family)
VSVPEFRVGVSGWRYRHWRGVYYPKGLVQRRELAYLAGRLNSAEINGSFYSLQRPAFYQRWAAETPPDFVFAVKGSRYITHMKKLGDVQVPLANFLASGVLALGEKLGPLLWQLPPSLGFDRERLTAFFDLLPRTTGQAVELAKQHDERLTDRSWLAIDADRPIRHALEVRHRTFETAECPALLHAHDIALVVADTAGRFPLIRARTSDFVYVRLHGDEELYASDYSAETLDEWAGWVAGQRSDAYVYFDNDGSAHAPFNAEMLAGKLGISR